MFTKMRFGDGDLIYVSAQVTYILSYADGSIQGTLPQSSGITGLCSDAQGNVFVPTPGIIFEYSHGGKTPIAQLKESNYNPGACSIDPVSGNLAVCNTSSGRSNQNGNVAIYTGATGSPTFYSIPKLTQYFSCAYDGGGNLFIGAGNSKNNAFHFAELPEGSNQIELLKLNKQILGVGRMQWDGQYLVIAANSVLKFYRVSVSGLNAKVISVTKLYGIKTVPDWDFWIHGGMVLTSAGPHSGSVGLWQYPRGRKLTALYHD